MDRLLDLNDMINSVVERYEEVKSGKASPMPVTSPKAQKQKVEAAPPPPALLKVRMIAEAAAVVAVPPPPEPQRPKPMPQPRLVATSRPAPAAIVTPPPEPEAVAEPIAEVPAPAASPAVPATSEPAAAEPAVVPPDFVAAYLNNPPPAYPASAKLRHESGEVRLRVRVMTDGRAGDVQIERSSGSTALDQAARDVVFRKWRFVPAKRGEVPIEAWVIVPVVFQLRS